MKILITATPLKVCVSGLVLLWLVSTAAQAQQESLNYVVNDGIITITGLKSGMTSVNFPQEIEGLPVTSIGRWAFRNANLRSIELPDGLLTIGDHAFQGTQIGSISIPDSVLNIGRECFNTCANLESVKLPENQRFTRIERATFLGTSVKRITIPDSVDFIGFDAFAQCSALSSVIIGKGLVTIGGQAFKDAPNLEEIIFMGNKPKLHSGVFSGISGEAVIRIQETSRGFDSFLEGIPVVTMGSVADFVTEGGIKYLPNNLNSKPDRI
ncbi:leucine-rich repeat domain-containing protein [Verrucomicrobia bacterium]|nr:leucine-rich repeat domain-containing protein [Verrucomicrobiota bacterium]